ncbi:hypothetical protein MHBO_003497 [Bonamia ostreae]|uniref:Uncharacterized protein n=1 Tax=Bonamia ostreae TaxID=126728 RepID=A0ABV2AQM1_9EUKA
MYGFTGGTPDYLLRSNVQTRRVILHGGESKYSGCVVRQAKHFFYEYVNGNSNYLLYQHVHSFEVNCDKIHG